MTFRDKYKWTKDEGGGWTLHHPIFGDIWGHSKEAARSRMRRKRDYRREVELEYDKMHKELPNAS